MTGNILFQIPEIYKSALLSGEITRIGTLLKDNATGKIVAHVQESGLASKVLSGLTGISPFDPVNLLSSIYANVQLGHLKTMIEGLQTLQFVTLGASVVGIGVSTIGFAIINKKLCGIENQIMLLEGRMNHHFRELLDRDLRAHFSRIQGLIERANQAHSLQNPGNEWMAVVGALSEESSFMRGEIKYLLEQKKFDTELFSSLVSTMALCDAGRIESLILSDELQAAQNVSTDIAHHYSSLFDNLSPVNLAVKIADPQIRWNPHSYDKLKTIQSSMNSLLLGVRDATDAAYTRLHLIETLMQRKINGRQYLQILQEEKEQPILLLPA